MPPRFDAENLSLTLSVADLLDTTHRRSLGFANRGGYERLWLGQAIHSRYQAEALEADSSYRREVPISHTFPHRGWEVTLQGRIDGIRREGNVLVVEEIKSVRRGGQLSAPLRKAYEQQALLYAWMLHNQGEDQVGAELILIEIGSDEIQRLELPTDFAPLEAQIRQQLNRLFRDFDRRRAAAEARHSTSLALEFPHPELRPGQQDIMDAVRAALAGGDHLLLQAPTGIGKTAAAIYPTLKFALAHEKKVFVLTAKTLQQEMTARVLTLLDRDGGFHSLRLRSKAKMCANDEIICHEEYCPFARDYYQKLHTSQILDRLLTEHSTLDPSRIFDTAQAAEVCPFEVSLELTGTSQVVVCDYNYAFDPYVSLRDFAEESDLSNTILIIDELHNLVSRGRDYYSPELSADKARLAAEGAQGLKPEVSNRIRALCLELAGVIERTVQTELDDAPQGAQALEAVLPEEKLYAYRADFDQLFIDYLEVQREEKRFRADDAFVEMYFGFLRFLNGLARAEGQAFSHCVQVEDQDHKLKILCKDPSRFIGAVLKRAHSVIGLSATLSPTDFYLDLLGFDPQRTAAVTIDTPFPDKNRRVVIDNTVATTWKERPNNYAPIAKRLSAFGAAVPGNCLALFPSYDFLAQVNQHLDIKGKRVLVQNRTNTDAEREEMLDTLRTAFLGDVLLLAVAGGVFAEGVDYPGDMLQAVAVIGPCLPPVSLEQELLKRYFEERFERGFEYAFVVPGMTRVIQAAGRLIRSEKDQGVIALFDRRFLASPYRTHLYADWIPAEGFEAMAGDPAAVAAEFFAALPT